MYFQRLYCLGTCFKIIKKPSGIWNLFADWEAQKVENLEMVINVKQVSLYCVDSWRRFSKVNSIEENLDG